MYEVSLLYKRKFDEVGKLYRSLHFSTLFLELRPKTFVSEGKPMAIFAINFYATKVTPMYVLLKVKIYL